MIPSLLQLWLATVYVLAVACVVVWWNNRGEAYTGRHRPQADRREPFSWRDQFEARIAATAPNQLLPTVVLRSPWMTPEVLDMWEGELVDVT